MSFDPNIKKFCQVNSMTSERRKSIPFSIHSTYTEMFLYVVKSKIDTESLQRNLETIPSHVSGDHKQCQKQWCKYLQDLDNYKPIHLPYGIYLFGVDLLKDLQYLFSDLAFLQTNFLILEALRQMRTLTEQLLVKIPSGSESTSFRVAAAVAHKNIGHVTIGKVYQM